MPFSLKLLVSVLALVVIGVGAAVVLLRPPASLEVPVQGIVLSGVTLINPGLDRRPNQRVTVRNGRIDSIEDAPAEAGDPSAFYRGTYVLPGLIDMHVHNPPPPSSDFGYFMLMYLAYGVTTIRDTGNDGQMFAGRKLIAEGKLAGPRVFTCGQILDGDPPIWPDSIVVRNSVEAERAVRRLAAEGADFIKVYENLQPDALAGIVQTAHRLGLQVVGHVPRRVAFEQAHIDDVQHLTGVPNLDRRLYRTATEYLLARAAAWQKVDDARIAFVIRTSLDQHIAHTPTMVVEYRSPNVVDFETELRDPIVNLMPSWYPEVIWPVMFPRVDDPSARAKLRVLNPAKTRRLVVRKLHEAVVKLHVGTDTMISFVVPGESMHEEMANFIDAGFTPAQAWAAATRENGQALSLPNLGILRVGAPADLLIFRHDPSSDLSELASLDAVVADGRLYTRHQIDEGLKTYRERFSSPFYRAFVNWQLRRAGLGQN